MYTNVYKPFLMPSERNFTWF